MINIEFEVKKIKFRDVVSGYTVMEIKLLKHPEGVEIPTAQRIVTGNFLTVHVKDEYKATGNWIDSGKFGFVFQAETHQLIFPETAKGMMLFLKNSVEGIGNALAKRIVEKFKEDTFLIITNDPDKLLLVPGITEKKKEAIFRSVNMRKEFDEVAVYLLGLGLSHMDCSKIYAEMGYAAISKISDNPYILTSLDGFSFKTADKVARQLDLPIDNPDRIYHGILHFLETQMNSRGDMFSYRKDIYDKLVKHLGYHGGYEFELKLDSSQIDKAITRLKNFQKIKTEIFNGEECIYVSFYNYVENSIVEKIYDKTNSFNHWICEPEEAKEYLENGGFSLAKRQKEAIEVALFNKLSIISGGPGTGKTHTVNAAIKTIQHFKPRADIKLCAPTGRAAKRMTEMTGMPAETIHRLVKLMGGGNEDGKFEEVDADFLIIDESSMIDAYVFHVLLSSVTDKTRIILVGDYNQLPSVGPGLILRDLMESEMIPVTILNEIFRQAQDSQIVTNSYKLINGQTFESLTFDKKKRDFLFQQNKDVESIINISLNVISKALREGNNLDDIQVITVLNGGDLGVLELNRRIQRAFNPKSLRTKNEVTVRPDLVLREGDRVIQTKNNYDLNVFNGEIGKVETVEVVLKEGVNVFQLIVDFGDRQVVYDEENIEELALAYAISAHKSQGSEFKFVIMPIHRSHRVLLSRNIIYTVWTRAKEKLIMVGDSEELADGMAREDNTVRNSLIKYKLKYKKAS